MLFIHLFTDFMKDTKKKKIVILGRKEKVGVIVVVILGRKEKVGVDPPPSPTTPASYREIFKYWV